MLCTSDEHFSARDECINNMRVEISAGNIQLYNYQQLSNRTYLKMIATHRYSPPKTGGNYHALILTSVYTTYTHKLYMQ